MSCCEERQRDPPTVSDGAVLCGAVWCGQHRCRCTLDSIRFAARRAAQQRRRSHGPDEPRRALTAGSSAAEASRRLDAAAFVVSIYLKSISVARASSAILTRLEISSSPRAELPTRSTPEWESGREREGWEAIAWSGVVKYYMGEAGL